MMILIRSYIQGIPRQKTPLNDMNTDSGHDFNGGFLQREFSLSSLDDFFIR
jgi:hypothetical protein